MGLDSFVFDGIAKVPLQLSALADLPVHAGFEEAETVPPVALGAVEGEVGRTKDLSGACPSSPQRAMPIEAPSPIFEVSRE